MAFAALAVDQVTKTLALMNSATLGAGIKIFPGFDLVLIHNPGISFGMLGDVPWWTITLVGLVICAVLAVLLWQTESRFEAIGYGLIIGGALGNIVDRIRQGSVTDFLDFYYRDAHWPAFNLADAAIFCGAAAMILSNMAEARTRKKPPE